MSTLASPRARNWFRRSACPTVFTMHHRRDRRADAQASGKHVDSGLSRTASALRRGRIPLATSHLAADAREAGTALRIIEKEVIGPFRPPEREVDNARFGQLE